MLGVSGLRRISCLVLALCLVASSAAAQLISDSTSVAGDSISRGFDADTSSCNYGDNVSRNWATGDDHGSSYCSAGGNGTFSLAERLECSKNANITIFNNAESGAKMVSDFYNQAVGIRSNLSGAAGPRLVSVLLGHNDACTSETSKSGNSCGGDRDPNNYCRTTNAAFEREFRRGLDQLIQIEDARIGVFAVIRVSQLCNFESKNGCGLSFGLNCDVIWSVGDIVGDLFGGGICASLTSNCSSQRRVDMYNTLVGYNSILERVTNEYLAIPPGGTSATGAVKADGVEMRYLDGTFNYKFSSNDVSCCDCFHPSDQGQFQLSQFAWNGLDCSTFTQCCGATSDPLAAAKCDITDTWSEYQGLFWGDGVVCGNGILDPGELCDDGNSFDGDCCSSSCQLVPSGTACADDGNQCTDDVCDGFGSCSHPGLDATPCDDGLFCNGQDTCSNGTCVGGSIDPCAGRPECDDVCNEVADNCEELAGVPCTDDGNQCTGDVCGGGLCIHPPVAGSCDDGVFCNGPDICSSGACSIHLGDPCVGGSDCANLCDESADSCFDPAGSGCLDDGNACTDDVCDGAGACLHPNNTAPCEDGNACTSGDACSGGTCAPGAPVVCDNCQSCDPFSGCGGPICTSTATFTRSATPTATPTVTSSATATASSTPVPTSTPTSTATTVPTATPTVCPAQPMAGCRVGEKSVLRLVNDPDDRRDKVLWKLIQGESTTVAEFADPIFQADYVWCVYDADGRILRVDIGAGSGWQFKGSRGYKYKDSLLLEDGVQKVRLGASDRDRTKILLKGRGENTPHMTLGGRPTPITAQLFNGQSGACWEAVFLEDDVRRNDAFQLKATARP